MKNCSSWKQCNPYPVMGRSPRDLDLYFAPKKTGHPPSRTYPFDLDVVVYDRGQEALSVDAHLTVRNQAGAVIERFGPVRVDLEPEVAKADDPPAVSKSFEAGLDLGSGHDRVFVELEVEGATTLTAINARLTRCWSGLRGPTCEQDFCEVDPLVKQ